MEHLSFGIVDIAVFLAFILLVLSVGFYKSKGEKTHGDNGAADYFLARKEVICRPIVSMSFLTFRFIKSNRKDE